MVAGNLTVAGRRFRTQADYEAALRDQKKIEAIRATTNLENPTQLNKLFGELQSGSYRFETIVGNDFDDEIYDRVCRNKTGSAADNTGRIRIKSDDRAGENTRADKRSRQKPKAVDQKEIDKQAKLALLKLEKRRRRIIIVASIVAAVCIGYTGIYYFFYARTNLQYQELAALKGSESLTGATEKSTLSLHKSAVKLPDILDEYLTLYEKNKKLIGWIKIDDTNIDYPVMQTTDNEYYLEYNFNQEFDKNGSIFLDYNCNAYPRSTNMIVYGHHMKSGNMFGSLQKYAKESYAKKHNIITFDTIYEKAQYEVMYVFRSQVYAVDENVFKYYQFIDANSKKEFDNYMQEMDKLSLFDTGITAEYGDSLLTLSTCDSSQEDGRFVVVAKRI